MAIGRSDKETEEKEMKEEKAGKRGKMKFRDCQVIVVAWQKPGVA